MDDSFLLPKTKPVLGIFTKSNHIDFLLGQNTNDRVSAIIRAKRIAKITLYFFNLNDVDLRAKKVYGTYYHEKSGSWVRGVFPYPDVLYARGGSITQRDKFFTFNKQLEEMGVKRINAGPVFNKWDVLKNLKKNNNIAPHIPDSIVYKTAHELMLMLNKYGEVYLKACRGRKGMQVMRVKKMHPDFEYRFFRNHQLNKGILSFQNLIHLIKKFYKKRPFIIQQAINLPRINDSIYDLRAELQRNGKGELEIVEILVRVSQPGAPITTHASSYLFDIFYARVAGILPERIAAMKKSINDFLAAIYLSIENAYGPYGEIGIDFAVDKAGQLWFIECNSRSTKVSLFKAAGEETRLRSYVNPFAYAKFLHLQGREQNAGEGSY